jgi:hypothetical protein
MARVLISRLSDPRHGVRQARFPAAFLNTSTHSNLVNEYACIVSFRLILHRSSFLTIQHSASSPNFNSVPPCRLSVMPGWGLWLANKYSYRPLHKGAAALLLITYNLLILKNLTARLLVFGPKYQAVSGFCLYKMR